MSLIRKHNILLPPASRRISFKSLSFQLSLIVIGIPTIALLIFSLIDLKSQTESLEKELNTFLKNETAQLSASLSSVLFNYDTQACELICRASLVKAPITRIVVWDGENEFLKLDAPDREKMLRTDASHKSLEKPILFNQENIGRVRIEVTTQYLTQEIRNLKSRAITRVLVLDVLLGLALFLILSARFVAPLRELKKSSEKIASGDLEEPINVHRNDEIGALADNMVIMRDAVKEKVDSLQAEVARHRETAMLLEKSEAFMRLIIDLIPHMIFVKNSEGRFLVVNQSMADSLESSVDSVTGRRHVDFAQNKERAQLALDDDFKVMQSGRPKSILTEAHNTLPGESRWFNTLKVPFTAPDGDEGVVGITIDISELKQAEQALEQTKQYINNIINSMPSALFSLDPDKRIVLWNRRSAVLYGISEPDAVSRPLTEVLPQMAPYMEQIDSAMAEQLPHRITKQFRQSGSEMIYEDITVYPLAGSVNGVVVRVDDVSEQVRMEELVVQSEKMMSVGGLAAGMAHEINNPLAGMMQNAQLVLRRIQEDIPASVKAAQDQGISLDQIRAFMENRGIPGQLRMIHETGIRVSGIVQNMLNFSRKEYTGKNRQAVTAILDKTIELCRSDYNLKKQYDFRKIEIIQEYEPNMPDILCEPGKLQQVFFNIIRNASQALQENKSDAVPPKIIIRCQQKHNAIRIEIEDNGPGMKEEVRKRIFEPFFTTKSVGKGTGLGLSVSYFIITDNHGGEMNAVSEPGKGTKFIIHLPVA